MKCLRLTHVNVRVDRLEPALRFYGEVLGLQRIPRAEAENAGAWFRLGTAEIHVAEDPGPQPPSKRHFAVEVDDLAAARKAVVDGGAAVEKEEPGRFWTRDPGGNRIEIVQARG